MLRSGLAAMILAALALPVSAADNPSNTERRWAGAVQVELSAGGDDLDGDGLELTKSGLGDGVSLALGLMYRPIPTSSSSCRACSVTSRTTSRP
jgi:hypothetical protein